MLSNIFVSFISEQPLGNGNGEVSIMKKNVIVASDLFRHFAIDNVIDEAVKNLHLTVKAGEFIAIH